MIAARLLDVLIVLLLLVYLGEGFRNGFVRSISAVLGVIAGGAAAFFLIPVIASIVPDPFWRTFLIVAISVALLLFGYGIGRTAGRAVRGRQGERSPGVIDRLLGAVVNLVIAAIVVALIAGSVGSLGVPLLSKAVSDSIVLRVIDGATPEPLKAALDRLRGAVLAQGLPVLPDVGGVTAPPTAPSVPTDTQSLAIAAQSVVRINGTAYACGQNQSGSGFVIARNRVITNAHVVAGVGQPVVEAPNGQTIEASIVYFDPEDDLAVLAVNGLGAAPLPVGGTLQTGSSAVVDGYPYGGPFTTGSAQVLAVTSSSVADIYNKQKTIREIYSLAADVQPGNSGGPLLSTDGRIAGIVFARSATQSNLGYAMTDAELQPVIAKAPTLSAPVSSGACVRG